MICLVPSMGRAGDVLTARLFPKYKTFICVPEDELDAYLKFHDSKLLVGHPTSLIGLGPVRQWMLDNIPSDDKIVVMADDDLIKFQWLGGYEGYTGGAYRTIRDPAHVFEVLLQTAHICRDAGSTLFGFSETNDIRKFNYPAPFHTRTRINGTAMGIINDGQVKFDPRLVLKQDFDFSLMTLYCKRFVWRDSRYAFVAKHWSNKGGCVSYRTIEAGTRCIEIMQEKYGEDVVFPDKKLPWKIHVRIPQRLLAK